MLVGNLLYYTAHVLLAVRTARTAAGLTWCWGGLNYHTFPMVLCDGQNPEALMLWAVSESTALRKTAGAAAAVASW